jgi:hypothetical protein
MVVVTVKVALDRGDRSNRGVLNCSFLSRHLVKYANDKREGIRDTKQDEMSVQSSPSSEGEHGKWI